MCFDFVIYIVIGEDNEELGKQEFIQYDFATLSAATSEFSVDNKLGEGGFGLVYKVIPKTHINFSMLINSSYSNGL